MRVQSRGINSRKDLDLPDAQTSTTVRRHRADHWILIDCALLLAIGLMLIYSISPALADTTGVSGSYYVTREIIAIALSIIAFIVTTKIPIDKWRAYYKWLLGLAALATMIAIVLPVNPNYPAHRWVRFAGLSFESVELLIVAILIWFANFLSIRIKNGTITNFSKTVKPLIGVILVVAGVVAMVQSDLGSTGVIVIMMGVMAFVAGLPIKRIMMVVGVIAALTVVAVLAFPYRIARLETFLHPTANCLTTGYQSCQAMIAVGSGGATGLGLGSGVQAYGYLPEADNDSIFAIFAEKFGFIGSIALLAIFGSLFYRISKVASGAPDNFSRLVAVGVLVWISVEALINIGAMVGLLPLKGITLPFISYGGTSVVFFAAAMGLVYQTSRYSSYSSNNSNRRSGLNDYNGHGRRIGGAYHPDLGSSS